MGEGSAEEDGVDAVLEACGGDPRAAIRALLVANDFLESELERAHALLSTGFVRGRLRLTTTDKISKNASG